MKARLTSAGARVEMREGTGVQHWLCFVQGRQVGEFKESPDW
jgi:hypothetical protein